MNILSGTPVWVFPLFVLLLIFSVWQSRARSASLKQLAILPLIFISVSLARLANIDHLLSANYLLTLLAAAALFTAMRSTKKITRDENSSKLLLAKDYLRGTGIMLIFCCQYYLAARHAIVGSALSFSEYTMISAALAIATSPMLSSVIAAAILQQRTLTARL